MKEDMVVTERNVKDWEALDEARMQRAFEEILASENLRFLIRSLFASWGLNETPYTDNALTTAHLCGRHKVATEFLDLCFTYQPTLYPSLLKEDQNEQTARNV